MTTTVPREGADSLDESGALDPFKGLRALLPKRARPAWIRLMGTRRLVAQQTTPSPRAAACIRRNDRRLVRLSRALAGEFTRSRAAPS